MQNALTNAAFFVDLPNFYSRLLKSDLAEPRSLRDYFLYWLDFDLLATSLTESFSGIWIFYSGERIGPSDERIEGEHLKKYIRRINALEGVTARDVNIKGSQREPVEYECSECGHEGVGESQSEKGIDASLTVHLFDTMDSWDVAFLISGDADFVPAVASLRRRGKIVVGAGFHDVSSEALIRECYKYIDLRDVFLRVDVALYLLFGKGGIAEKWFTDEVRCDPKYTPESVTLAVKCSVGKDNRGDVASLYVSFDATRPVDLSTRYALIRDFAAKFVDAVEMSQDESTRWYSLGLTFGPEAWRSLERRLSAFAASIKGLQFNNKELRCTMEYKYNSNTGGYDPVAVPDAGAK